MKKLLKNILIIILALTAVFAFAGCSFNSGRDGKDGIDGENGVNGINGKDGENGKDVSITEIYEKYVEEYGEISYADFLKQYLSFNTNTAESSASVIGGCMLSVAKVYTEFIETHTYSMGFGRYYQVSDVALSAGSAVIWSIDKDDDGYTYLVTNYHVIYDANADTAKNVGNIARNINIYLYGSESNPTAEEDKDADGYTVYSYGSYAVNCEYVGGTINADIAVIRAKTENLKEVNSQISAVTLADEYYVGQTAIAIGNPEDEGISVTQGVISVENENITLKIDGTARTYRSIRIDTPLYSGNSGGGLFDDNGRLIGITNAGDGTDQNINFAVPLEIVKGAVENILYYFNDGDDETVDAYKIVLGLSVLSANSKYVYNQNSGYGKITEEVIVSSVNENSIAQNFSLEEGDKLCALNINGTSYNLIRSFNISDILMNVRPGDRIGFIYQRDGESYTTSEYTVQKSDLVAL